MSALSEMLEKLGILGGKSAEESASVLAKPNLAGKIDDSLVGALSDKDASVAADTLSQPNHILIPGAGQDLSAAAQADALSAQKTARAVPMDASLTPTTDPTSKALIPLSGSDLVSKPLATTDDSSPMVLRDVTPKTSQLPIPYADQTSAVSGLSDEQVAGNPILSALKKAALPAAAIGGAVGLGSLLSDGGGSQPPQAIKAPVSTPDSKTPASVDDTDGDEEPVTNKSTAKPVVKNTDDLDEEEAPTKSEVASTTPVSDKKSDFTPGMDDVDLDKAAPLAPENTLENLKAAQKESRYINARNKLDNALNEIGAAFGTPMKQFVAQNDIYGDSKKPLEEFQQRAEVEKADPASQYSTNLRQFVKDKVGYDIPDNVGADQLNSTILKPVVQMYEIQEKAKETAALKQLQLAQVASENEKNRDSREQMNQDRLDQRSQQAQLMAAMTKDKLSSKSGENQDKAYTEMLNKAQTFRGNKAAQQASMDLLNGKKALALVENKDPNTLSRQDLQLLADEMAKVATGGVPGEHGVQALMPNTAIGKLKEMQSFLSNHPTDAQAGAYVQHNMNYLKGMMNVAQGQLDQFEANTVKGYKNRVGEDHWNDYIQDHPSVQALINHQQPQSAGQTPQNLPPQVAPSIPGGQQRAPQQGNTPNIPAIAAQYSKLHGIPLDQATAIISKRLGM